MTEPLPVFEIRCCFCHCVHRSEFFDDIEREILACRDKAPECKKGSLDTFEDDPNIRPIRPETAAFAGGYYR